MRVAREEEERTEALSPPPSPAKRVVFFHRAAEGATRPKEETLVFSLPPLLVDQNVRWHVVQYLTSHGVELSHASTMGLERAPDEEIFAEAKRLQWVILTHDRGFADPFRFDPSCSPGAIILPGFLPDRSLQANRAVLTALDYIVDKLPERISSWQGKLVRFTPHGEVVQFAYNAEKSGVATPYVEEVGTRDRFVKACLRYDTLPRFAMWGLF